MSLNLKALAHLTTPQYLLISLISPFATYLIINTKFPGLEITPIVVSLSLAVLGFNAYNQISDIEIDKIDKPLRPLVSKEISLKQAFTLTIFFYLSSLILALLTNILFFTLMLLFTFTTYAYCNKRTYLKKKFWSSSFVGLVIYGAIPYLSAYSISENELKPVFLIFFSLLFFVISNTKDFEDMPGEKKFGIKSLPLVIGSDLAGTLIVVSEAIVLLSMTTLAYFGVIHQNFLYAGSLSLIMLVVIAHLFLKEIKKIKYINIAFGATNNKDIRRFITQSDAPTLSIVFVLIVELIYAFTSLTVL